MGTPTNVISPVPNNQPVTDKNGMISQIWSGFFNQLWARTGGANAPSNTALAQAITDLAASNPNSIVGNNTSSVAAAVDLTPAQVVAMLPTFSSALTGLVPASGGGTAKFLRADGAFAVPPVSVLDFFVSSSITTSSSNITSSSFVTASNSPGLSFNPNYTGKYKVYASIPMIVTGSTIATAVARIANTSGSAILLAESQGIVSASATTVGDEASVYCQSVYSLNSGTNYIFNFQAKIDAGTGVIIDGTNSQFYIFAERVA
jgi:hypothetical protein